MKVVYNCCFGGFSLSEAGVRRYLSLRSMPHTDDLNGLRNIDRSCPFLVQTVEELGKRANGPFAALDIIDIPAGSLWRIDEYDGMESVMTVDDYEWNIAT